MKKCSENIQQIYKKTPMPKCNFNKVALQLCRNHTSVWVVSCKFAVYFQNTFSQKHLWEHRFWKRLDTGVFLIILRNLSEYSFICGTPANKVIWLGKKQYTEHTKNNYDSWSWQLKTSFLKQKTIVKVKETQKFAGKYFLKK